MIFGIVGRVVVYGILLLIGVWLGQTIWESTKLKWPTTWRGMKTLFWLTIGFCPVHHRPLHGDPWSSDDTGYCFKCDGIGMWPCGFLNVLRSNTKATQEKEAGGKK